MHSLGNDFIILDGQKISATPEQLKLAKLADRRVGIGCDQVIYLYDGANADVHMRIINADGTEVEACGNATRCVGWLVMEEKQKLNCTIRTQAGLLECSRDALGSDVVTANMGIPRWAETGLEGNPLAVNMGNPHLVFFVEDVNAVLLAEAGAKWEHHPQFPNRTNVEFVEALSPSRFKMRVWERGVGITQACGTGACATLVAAMQRGLAQQKVTIQMDGGDLEISWSGKASDSVFMKGVVSTSFSGHFLLNAYAL
jgi:diaminopimelate epimerase